MKPEVGPYEENAVDDDSSVEQQDENEKDKDKAGKEDADGASNSKQEEPSKPNFQCEVKEYEARYNFKGERNIKEAGSKPDIDEKPSDKPQYAMRSYKYYKRDGSIESAIFEVHSPHVQEALRTVIKTYPGQSFGGSVISLSGVMDGDAIACLFHYRQELEAHGKAQQNLEAKMHILLAVKFVQKELRRAVQRHQTQIIESKIPVSGYEDLWMLFKPGDLAFAGTGHNARALEIVSVQYKQDEGLFGDPAHFLVMTKAFSHDGYDFGYKLEKFKISPYGGTIKVRELNIYPLKFHTDEHSTRETLIKRGKKFCGLTGVQYKSYEGEAWAVSYERVPGLFGNRDEYPEEAIEIKDRIVIDCLSFIDNMTNKDLQLKNVKNVKADEISDDDYLLCRYLVPGFALTEKRWCWFMIDYIDDIKFEDNFKTLLLPDGQKRLVRALTRQHALGHDNFDDIIKNKGKGCIFLLHGPPGVGKTATVESIADDIQRPMYVMMSGDLGSDLKSVEKTFNKTLKLMMRWKGILLIDEADVFLERRSSHDLARNSLVSILLRSFEYFSGIMFMTTNRVDCIDAAFQSRIHLALTYSPLDTENRKKLWRMFLQRTANYKEAVWSDDTLTDLAKYEVNGRQIKNAVRTANSLALSEEHELSVDDVHVVLETVGEFQKVYKPQPSPRLYQQFQQQNDTAGLSSLSLRPPLL